MSNEGFILFITTIGLLGLALAIHLLVFAKRNIPAKILGLYTLLLTISSVEPLKQYWPSAKQLIEMTVAAGSFMIGPVLFLYCDYRLLNKIHWKNSDNFHFIPAALITVLMAIPPKTSEQAQDSLLDFVAYLLFVCHVLVYTSIAFSVVMRSKKQFQHHLTLPQFHFHFILFLVISSLVLFLYSFCSTFLGLNDSFQFKLFIQGFLTFIIIVIVLLNAETLEDHNFSKRQTVDGEK